MIKLKTSIFRDMLNKAFKICDMTAAKQLPLVGLIEIEFNENGISIKSTDNITTMIVTEKMEGLTPGRVTVDADIITNLVNKITTDEIELNISDNSLTIIGNGVYNLEIRVDESGEVIKLPVIDQELINKANKDFDFKGIVERLKICSSAIATGQDLKEMNNYYLKDIIATTDQQKLCSITNVDSMKDDELFFKYEFGNHLMELDFVAAKYAKNEEKLVIVGENFVIGTSMFLDELNMFNSTTINGIRQLSELPFSNKVKITKANLIGLLDRLTLFVSQYDSNSISITFLPEELRITNIKGTCNEVIKYEEKELSLTTEYSTNLNMNNLKQLLSVLPNDVIEIQFDNDSTGVKIVDGNITQFIAILDEE